VTRGRGLALAVAAGTLVRAPFLAVALRAPLDADTSIIGLMARHPLRSATMWGQPYGSPLEGWLAAPFVLAIPSPALAMRLFYAALGLALVPIAYLLAEAFDRRAALPAGLLAACAPSYFLLLAVLPPPLYPSTLLLGGLALLFAVRLGERLARGEAPFGRAVLWGLLCGAALWTHLSALGPAAAGVLYLLVRGRRRLLVPITAGLAAALGSLPLWAVETRYGGLWRVVRVADHREHFGPHFVGLAASLHRTLGGLFSAHTPIVADAVQSIAAPGVVVVLLAVLYVASVPGFLKRLRADPRVGLLLAAAVLATVFFLVPLRSQAHTTRFLVALYLPVTVAFALAWAGTRIQPVLVAMLCVLNLAGGASLLRALRALDMTRPPYGVGSLGKVRAFLEQQGVSRAFADYEIAYRLSFASGERLLVSQPINERFPGHPLPYLDEVRFASDVAWILAPGTGNRLPRPAAFSAALERLGGRWKARRFGTLTVYYAFAPPFGPEAQSLPGFSVPAGGTAGVDLPSPRPLAALELYARDGVWPRGLDVEAAGADGRFTTVERVRYGPPFALAWVNGHPEMHPPREVLVVPMAGLRAAALRVTSQSGAGLDLERVLLHEVPQGEPPPWPSPPPAADWGGRRLALAAEPHPNRADWVLRSRLAAKAP
jgi:hypothetical protein